MSSNLTIMNKLDIKNKVFETIDYLLENSLDSLRQIKSDPENVIWETELQLEDDDYDYACSCVNKYSKNH